jgi:decaprenylphospho-beta-D-ribofuranose 2-oxidase
LSFPSKPDSFFHYGSGLALEARRASPDSRRVFEHSWQENDLAALGSGLSLAPAGFGKGRCSVGMENFDRILTFDAENGLVEVEAGITLGRLASCTLQHHWYLAIQPGHPMITVGGCIASNAHGKNQYRDGTFYDIVQELRLFHPDHGTLELKKGDPLFELTCGGYGLTGLILSSKLQLKRLPSQQVRVKSLPCPHLRELPQRLSEESENSDLLYSWHDLMSQRPMNGPSFIRTGSFEPTPPGAIRWDAYNFQGRIKSHHPWIKKLPCFYTPLSTKLLNRWFYSSETKKSDSVQELDSVLFPVKDRMIYYHLFGRRGLIEMQWLFPLDAWDSICTAIEKVTHQYSGPITLASGKYFRGTRSGLRFSGTGLCFSINVPHSPSGVSFAEDVDAIGVEHGGIPNLIKDARLPAKVVKACYPDFDSFVDQLHRHDPKRRFGSELSLRLGI